MSTSRPARTKKHKKGDKAERFAQQVKKTMADTITTWANQNREYLDFLRQQSLLSPRGELGKIYLMLGAVVMLRRWDMSDNLPQWAEKTRRQRRITKAAKLSFAELGIPSVKVEKGSKASNVWARVMTTAFKFYQYLECHGVARPAVGLCSELSEDSREFLLRGPSQKDDHQDIGQLFRIHVDAFADVLLRSEDQSYQPGPMKTAVQGITYTKLEKWELFEEYKEQPTATPRQWHPITVEAVRRKRRREEEEDRALEEFLPGATEAPVGWELPEEGLLTRQGEERGRRARDAITHAEWASLYAMALNPFARLAPTLWVVPLQRAMEAPARTPAIHLIRRVLVDCGVEAEAGPETEHMRHELGRAVRGVFLAALNDYEAETPRDERMITPAMKRFVREAGAYYEKARRPEEGELLGGCFTGPTNSTQLGRDDLDALSLLPRAGTRESSDPSSLDTHERMALDLLRGDMDAFGSMPSFTDELADLDLPGAGGAPYDFDAACAGVSDPWMESDGGLSDAGLLTPVVERREQPTATSAGGSSWGSPAGKEDETASLGEPPKKKRSPESAADYARRAEQGMMGGIQSWGPYRPATPPRAKSLRDWEGGTAPLAVGDASDETVASDSPVETATGPGWHPGPRGMAVPSLPVGDGVEGPPPRMAEAVAEPAEGWPAYFAARMRQDGIATPPRGAYWALLQGHQVAASPDVAGKLHIDEPVVAYAVEQ
jgi:hypothetical protein